MHHVLVSHTSSILPSFHLFVGWRSHPVLVRGSACHLLKPWLYLCQNTQPWDRGQTGDLQSPILSHCRCSFSHIQLLLPETKPRHRLGWHSSETIPSKWFHRITERLRLEGSSGGDLVQPASAEESLRGLHQPRVNARSCLLLDFVPLLSTLCAWPFSQVSATSLFAHPAHTSATCL